MCHFPSVPPFHWPCVSVCLNHLPAFIFHFSSLPLSRGSLAAIILTLYISFPPSCSRMGLKGALIKAKTCSRRISIRHQLQGPVPSMSSALTLFFSRTSFQSPRKSTKTEPSWQWNGKSQLLLRGWCVPLEALSCGRRQQGCGMEKLWRGPGFQLPSPAFCSLKVPSCFQSARAPCGMPWWHSFMQQSLRGVITAFTICLKYKVGHFSVSSNPCSPSVPATSLVWGPVLISPLSILIWIWADPLFFFS